VINHLASSFFSEHESSKRALNAVIYNSIRFLAVIQSSLLADTLAFSIRKIKQILAFQAIKIITEFFTIGEFYQIVMSNADLILQLKSSFTFLAQTAYPITVTAINQFYTLIQVNSSILQLKGKISS